MRLMVKPCCSKAPAEAAGEEDNVLVAWIVSRSSGEIRRIVSGSDISSLTDDRFASICKGSMLRISSVLDGGENGAASPSKGLESDLAVRCWLHCKI